MRDHRSSNMITMAILIAIASIVVVRRSIYFRIIEMLSAFTIAFTVIHISITGINRKRIAAINREKLNVPYN